MSDQPAILDSRHRRGEIILLLVPALAASTALFVLALRGPTDSVGLVISALLAFSGIGLVLARAPLFILWLVPVSMTVFYYMPLLHYEALVLIVAGVTLISALPRLGPRDLLLESIEWRYGLFLVALLPGLAGSLSPWRFFGTLKMYLVGFLGFEVARRGARHYGREAMLWGPALFCLITSGMLVTRVAELGLPGFKSVLLRTYITHLPWGTSNYVAAVLVLCMPGLVLLIGESPTASLRRGVAVGALAASLGTLLFTTSRGGFLLSVAYLLTLSLRMRRSIWVFLIGAAGFGAALVATPFGRGSIARFTNQQSLDSVIFRVRIWGAAWERGISHLPLGVGAGQGVLQDDKLQWMDPHSFPLTLFSEGGPLVLATWLWVLLALWGASRRLKAEPGRRSAGHALRATLVLAFFNSLFEPTFTGNLYFLLFWWLAGIFEAVEHPSPGPMVAHGPGA